MRTNYYITIDLWRCYPQVEHSFGAFQDEIFQRGRTSVDIRPGKIFHEDDVQLREQKYVGVPPARSKMDEERSTSEVDTDSEHVSRGMSELEVSNLSWVL